MIKDFEFTNSLNVTKRMTIIIGPRVPQELRHFSDEIHKKNCLV